MDIPFDVVGQFETNNVFLVQLSNDTGSFSSFTTMARVEGTTSDTARILVPRDYEGSRKYRVRVVSSSPYIVGEDNGADLYLPGTGHFHLGYNNSNLTVNDTVRFSLQRAHRDYFDTTLSYVWDFGEDAIPRYAEGLNTPVIHYYTPGQKYPSVGIIYSPTCTARIGYGVYVANCFPRIPNNARIVDADTSYGPISGHTWVRSGGFHIPGPGGDTIYAEAGSLISKASQSDVVYLKPGAQLQSAHPGVLVYAEGASRAGANGTLCSPLNFDYSEAPTPDQYANVEEAAGPAVQIARMGSTIEVLPAQSARSIEVYDILGRLIFQRDDINSFDTAGWTAGKYFLRVRVGSSIVSKTLTIE